MARFKVVDMSPRFLPVVLEQQLAPSTFEYALHTLIDSEFDLSALAAKFKNDETGAPAYDPSVLLKIVLLAYSRGMVSSRAIERACSESILFIAISGDTQPAYTTIAAFVRGLSAEIAAIFTEVILICDRQGLIGRQMFASPPWNRCLATCATTSALIALRSVTRAKSTRSGSSTAWCTTLRSWRIMVMHSRWEWRSLSALIACEFRSDR